MCEGVDICPGTGVDVSKAPCSLLKSLATGTLDVVDKTWEDMARLLQEEERTMKMSRAIASHMVK